MIYLARIGSFILTINLFSNALNSQDLTFDVNYASDEVLVGEDSVGVFYGSIINTSSENLVTMGLNGRRVVENNFSNQIVTTEKNYLFHTKPRHIQHLQRINIVQ